MTTINRILPPDILAEFNYLVTEHNLTALQQAHFLAQVSYESGRYKHKFENMNYSGSRLLAVFRKYFTSATVTQYHRKPEKIANRVYSNRMGNGGENSGDGWKYRGRGFIQLTGKNNYRAFDRTVPENILDNPDLVALKYPLTSAFWFFTENNLWSIAAQGNSEAVVRKITKRVNGGYHGFSERYRRFKIYNSIL